MSFLGGFRGKPKEKPPCLGIGAFVEDPRNVVLNVTDSNKKHIQSDFHQDESTCGKEKETEETEALTVWIRMLKT